MPVKPNILIFMTDHQRADTVLSEHPCVTPNVERLAADGVTFTDTYCPTPHCCPARATFMSGLYPSRHGVWNNVCNDMALSRGLEEGVRLWSEDLAEAGYDLVYTGKWHVSVKERPSDRGWREMNVGSVAGALHGVRWDHYEHRAGEGEPSERGEGQILRPGYGTYTAYGVHKEQRNDERSLGDALEALPQLAGGGKPWCLFVGMTNPHDPYFVPQRFLDLYDIDAVPLPAAYDDDMSDKPRIYQRMRRMRWDQLTRREIRETVRHFWAACSYLDDQFGRILDALDATGQADDTLVLYCADHGDYAGEHGLFAKGIPAFEGAYHVPAVVRWPTGVANPGRREDAFISLADFAPTFTELAGMTSDPELTGRSLTGFLRDESPTNWRDAIFTQCNGVELYYTQRTVRTKQWRYTFNGFDDDELYDLTNDPHETKNLAGDPAFNDIKRRLVRRMWRFAKRENDAATNNYITVALAPWGPAEAFREE
jgi:arylsulfatase A-like enzyme